ncbi:Ig domain-containing protein [Paludisphaera soli]|uniref:Ig domain-containing protein n=1 Tax=Paludisphaera soli TaxID=2712865 RepID=UPI0013ED9D4A|nr:Ig domain-containing protein [Paludisphaera soli]
MRRNRRGGGGGGLEFGGSGEDSFVAVVVTKLTGALLFILLLTMVIMALLPKAVDVRPGGPQAAAEVRPLRIATPAELPEAIAGRPYAVALAADGGRGPLRWTLDGPLPDGLAFDADSGLLKGTPKAGTPEPLDLALRVSDGESIAAGSLRLTVYQSDVPLSTPAWWKPGIPPVPWRAWLDQGVGFLILWLVHLVGMGALAGLERQSAGLSLAVDGGVGEASAALDSRRFALYRGLIRLSTLSAMIGLAAWLWSARA